MRSYFIILLLLQLIGNLTSAQNIICSKNDFVTKNIIKDFGAKADGTTNDQAAFEAAADFFNKRGGCGKLIIPFGLYKVGRQKIDTPKVFMRGIDVLHFDNVSNMTIEGIANNKGINPILKFNNGLYYGSFYYTKDKFGTPKCTPLTRNTDQRSIAQIGGAISINNSSNVTIKNIELDGNVDSLTFGGSWGDADGGRQLFHVGIFTNQGRNIKLLNIYTHHFALDGIENIGANDLSFENLTTEYNGRQGFSWVDGDSLIAVNCKFNRTGNAGIRSSPAAGIDIEPERKHDISFAQFTNCEIGYNRGCGLLMATGANTVKNMDFNKCTFLGLYNWSAWVPGTGIHFIDCKFYGNVVHTVPNKNVKKVKDITSFLRCYFSDIYNGTITKKPGGYYFPLNGEKIIIDSSVIKIFNRGFLFHANGCGPTDSLTSEIKNTVVYVANPNEWQVSATGIKITNTKVFSLTGKTNWACPNDYKNFERTNYTLAQMQVAFPEMNEVVQAVDSVNYFKCNEGNFAQASYNKKLNRRVTGNVIIVFYNKNCIITNNNNKIITGNLAIYDDTNKLVFSKLKIAINPSYTKAIAISLPSGKYTAKFIQKNMVLAANIFNTP